MLAEKLTIITRIYHFSLNMLGFLEYLKLLGLFVCSVLQLTLGAEKKNVCSCKNTLSFTSSTK